MSKLLKIPFYKLFNLFLRVGGMGFKFIIMIIMSKYFTNAEYADYGLIASVITILIFVSGVDFYFFSIRDILTGIDNRQKKATKVLTTFLLYLLIYFILLLILYPIFNQISYLKPFIFLVIFLGFTEHLSQEIYRLLISFKKILFANILFFFRTISWVFIIFYKIWFNETITLEFLLKIWLFANVIFLIIIAIYQLVINFNLIIKSTIDFQWLKKGLKIASVFFIGTISLKTIEYSNRFILDFFIEKEITAVFLFYANIAIIVTVYINTIVISFEVPALIEKSNAKNIISNLKPFSKSLRNQILVSFGIITLIIKPILFWQNKEQYANYLPILFILLAGVGLMNYSLKYHYLLYILHKDKIIVKVLVLTSFFSLILGFILTGFFGIYGASFSFLISGVLMYLLRKRESDKITLEL